MTLVEVFSQDDGPCRLLLRFSTASPMGTYKNLHWALCAYLTYTQQDIDWEFTDPETRQRVDTERTRSELVADLPPSGAAIYRSGDKTFRVTWENNDNTCQATS